MEKLLFHGFGLVCAVGFFGGLFYVVKTMKNMPFLMVASSIGLGVLYLIGAWLLLFLGDHIGGFRFDAVESFSVIIIIYMVFIIISLLIVAIGMMLHAFYPRWFQYKVSIVVALTVHMAMSAQPVFYEWIHLLR